MNSLHFARAKWMVETMNEIKLIPASKNDTDCIQKIFEKSPQYFLRISGNIAPQDAAESTLSSLPPGISKDKKHVLLVKKNGDAIGVIDLINGYPEAAVAFIGLLILREDIQGSGVGRKTYEELEMLIRTFHCKKIRLAVVENNPVFTFWLKMGFQPTGEKKPYLNQGIQSFSVLMEKEL